MTISSRFESFRISADGAEVVYAGRAAHGAAVEIRQAAADLDVMVVLIASAFGAVAAPSKSDAAHRTEAVEVEAAGDGALIVSLIAPNDIRRSFRLDRRLASRLSGEIAKASRAGLRLVPGGPSGAD